MWYRALLAFLACPGIFALTIPLVWLMGGADTRLLHVWGLAPLVIGLVALLWCVRDFYVIGRGTLAPWDPTQRLVEVGLYRYTRNPMYVAVSLILAGWAISFASIDLTAYLVIVMTAFELRVVFGEEPWLLATHGEQWTAYANRVPRWFW
jgi:protein-S-isoprenylcysteine O-methyltransferase Ste14